ncbi:pyruvate kinase [Mycolicibacterium palauense]|uniref:pyruvate kinase n=1 Tax=Mycolicibacterium palauense TaxID=2034511 RepID=UPI000BFEDF3B|nr:pyruvate kinase [Mycolicibacterium palauense]
MAADDLTGLQEDIRALLERLEDAERAWAAWIERVAEAHRPDALNLVHYWAIRQVDLRDIQTRLAALGLSSLGRSEANVQVSLRALEAALAALSGGPLQLPEPGAVPFGAGATMLDRNATELLGPAPQDHSSRIMVTLPSEAATDADLVSRLVQRGMMIARINCAHDDAEAWRAMAGHVRAAAAAAGRGCLIAMDLSGPKLRTGPLEPGPQVVRLRRTRNALGQTLVPARGWLSSAGMPADPPDPGLASLPVPGGWLRSLTDGDVVELRDTRDSRRWLEVEKVCDGGVIVCCEQNVYVGTGTELRVVGTGAGARVGALPPVEQALRLQAGDLLTVTRDLTPAPVDPSAPRIGCTLPEVFDNIATGDRVLFDDGKLGGHVTDTAADSFTVRIEHPAHTVVKLRAGKGINVPDTALPISALTDKDVADLACVTEIADLVQLSFVRHPEDVARLLDELERLGDHGLGIVLKIETQTGFENLPQLLLTGMRRGRIGVMIARGDLAVECGYERMAEVQEEILWLCEAAHLPVIWATQVLEQLAKTGLPSRAEISDAALAERAEAVMLNKGPYIDDAVSALRDILTRMAGHHRKKNALLRSLRSWRPTDLPQVQPPQTASESQDGSVR